MNKPSQPSNVSEGLGEFVIDLLVEIEKNRDRDESDEYEVDPEEVVLKSFLTMLTLAEGRKYSQCLFSPKLRKQRFSTGYFPLPESQGKCLH